MSPSAPTLNILGCGHVGRALGRLWHRHGIFTVQDVVNRSHDSALEAAGFIGAGSPLANLAQARSAQVWMIGTPDSAICAACATLAESGLLRPGDVVFHCSGALPSSVLSEAASRGAAIAGIHPIRSFADPAKAAEDFAGTWCGAEGDRAALDLLAPAFEAAGARLVAIDPSCKTIYHGAAVFASNYLVTLIEASLQAYEKAGVPRETAQKLVEPLVRGTIDNVFSGGTEKALSGPIARGDAATVLTQYRALRGWNRGIATLYRAFVKPTALLAKRRQRRGT